MSHADYLRELLRPLRVYELTGTANGGELEAVGEALDGGGAALSCSSPPPRTGGWRPSRPCWCAGPWPPI